MRTIDQTKRIIVNVPVPFTEEQLLMLVKYFNGWQENEAIAKDYVAHIIKNKRVDLNPSSALGEGCNIVDIFNTGFMVIMKKVFDIDVDADICWWHPMSPKVISKIGVVEWEEEEVDIASNEHVITHAIDAKTGKTVTAVEAAQTAGLCPGNSDDLTKYTD